MEVTFKFGPMDGLKANIDNVSGTIKIPERCENYQAFHEYRRLGETSIYEYHKSSGMLNDTIALPDRMVFIEQPNRYFENLEKLKMRLAEIMNADYEQKAETD